MPGRKIDISSIPKNIDGIRAQIHKTPSGVRIFSRTLNEITTSYPEIASAIAAMPGVFMLDREIVVRRDGRVLPFRYLRVRLQRKTIDAQLLQEIPVAYMGFDALAVADELLIDTPLIERREKLAEIIKPSEHVAVTAFVRLGEPPTPEELHDRFEAARAAGHEGLMLKRELSTLDVVVVAVEWGHGKRAKVLSDYTFAVRGEGDQLLTIGKAYSGLTDVEIADLTKWFLAHERGRAGHRLLVEPRIVLEVAFDILQPSDLHESGFSLRFPRIVRVRDDKPPEEIDTLERVREIYREMLARERVER